MITIIRFYYGYDGAGGKKDQQQGGSVEQTLILWYISPVIYRPHSLIMIKENEYFCDIIIVTNIMWCSQFSSHGQWSILKVCKKEEWRQVCNISKLFFGKSFNNKTEITEQLPATSIKMVRSGELHQKKDDKGKKGMHSAPQYFHPLFSSVLKSLIFLKLAFPKYESHNGGFQCLIFSWISLTDWMSDWVISKWIPIMML